jgi:hypothetical protein
MKNDAKTTQMLGMTPYAEQQRHDADLRKCCLSVLASKTNSIFRLEVYICQHLLVSETSQYCKIQAAV